jgi:hypothetical protein
MAGTTLGELQELGAWKTEWAHTRQVSRVAVQPLDFLVGRVGIEPTTNGLRVQPVKHRIILIINLFSRVG